MVLVLSPKKLYPRHTPEADVPCSFQIPIGGMETECSVNVPVEELVGQKSKRKFLLVETHLNSVFKYPLFRQNETTVCASKCNGQNCTFIICFYLIKKVKRSEGFRDPQNPYLTLYIV
jgi:hypothetical protein